MKHILTIFLSILIFSTVSAEGSDVLFLLKRDLSERIEVKSDTEVWFCPDNTCHLYKIEKPNPDFLSFIYLHLFHKSTYIYLNERISGKSAFRKVAIEEPKIRLKMSHYCPIGDKTPKCILENMKKEMGVVIGFGRYDTGYFCYGYKENENICNKL